MSIRKYGWKKAKHDPRDLKFSEHLAHTFLTTPLPDSVDLRPKMPQVYDQGDLGSCHDPETEVLTDSGWKKFDSITLEDKLASFDPYTYKLIFENPTRIIKKRHVGTIYKVQHTFLDFVVTPDHEMIFKKWSECDRTLTEDFYRVKMKDIGWYVGLPATVNYQAKDKADTYILKGVEHKHKPQREDKIVSMDSWLKFLGIYIAEGTILKEEYKIQIAATKEREKSFIRSVLSELDINYLELEDRFTFSNKRIYKSLESLGLKGIKAPEKFIPEFVFHVKPEYMKSFIEGHFAGDGSQQHETYSHYTSSKKLAEDLQRLIFLSGDWANIYSRPPRTSTMKDGRVVNGKHPEYRVSRTKNKKLSIDRKQNVVEEDYDGLVYCAEVPTYHTLVTRRNGKILISGNCTANAVAGIFQYLQIQEKLWDFTASRLFIYYNERILDGSPADEDTGSQIKTGIQVLVKFGGPVEILWPYDTSKFADKPPQSVFIAATHHKLHRYLKVDNTNETELMTALANGHPIAFGFNVYNELESDEVAKTGILPMPTKDEESIGGHAVVVVGYEKINGKLYFIIRNSWGEDWGDKGYFYMPAEYITNGDLANDFWVMIPIRF